MGIAKGDARSSGEVCDAESSVRVKAEVEALGTLVISRSIGPFLRRQGGISGLYSVASMLSRASREDSTQGPLIRAHTTDPSGL